MEWKITPGLTPYPEALEVMAARVEAIQRGEAEELCWLVEHPPLYTRGTSAKGADVLAQQFPVFESGRGGQVTYHGPGQRVVYVMRDLKKHAGEAGPDLRAYVKQLEQWIILTLAQFGIEGFTRDGRVGVWVEGESRFQSPESSSQNLHREDNSQNGDLRRNTGLWTLDSGLSNEKKIAALGVRVQKWVTSHGVALNVAPDLSHYAGIVPCGIREFGVTSMRAMGSAATMEELDAALKESFMRVFE